MLKALRNRIMLMFANGTVTGTDDSKGLQSHQITGLKDEVLEGITRIGNYGHAYNPPAEGTEHFTAFMGGNRDYGVILGTQHRDSRPRNLAPGENMIYTDEGDFIYFKRGKEIEIFTGKKLTVNATDDVELNTKRVVINASESYTVNAPAINLNGTATVNITTPDLLVESDTTIINCADAFLFSSPGFSLGADGSGGTSSGDMTFTDKTIYQAEADFQAGVLIAGISGQLNAHNHGGVQTGTGNTGGPN